MPESREPRVGATAKGISETLSERRDTLKVNLEGLPLSLRAARQRVRVELLKLDH